MPYDERPLPTLQRNDLLVETIQIPAEQPSTQPDAHKSPPSPGLNGDPEPLTEKAQREASLPIEVYGERLVRKT